MTESLATLILDAAVTRSLDCARFAAQSLKAVSYPGSELPRGYFCSVTPP
ncbi:hypothetical protein [Massilia sp. Bi118]|nr:hypothetical protein [Massilia sp. Bi118]